MARKEDLTDEQWAFISLFITQVIEREHGKRRPRLHDDRSVMYGILWILHTKDTWRDMPPCLPSGSTCYSCFSHLIKEGTFKKI